jgi:hypothetical protein
MTQVTRPSDRYSTWLGAALPAIVLLSGAVAVGLHFRPYHDESLYRPLIIDYSRKFDAQRIITYKDTTILTGPVTFLVYSVWARLVGVGLPALRSLSVLFAAAAGAFLVATDNRLGRKHAVLVGLTVCALPMFLATGTLVLSEPLSLAAAAVGTFLWVDGARDPSRSNRLWLSAVPLAVAANARATWLALPLSLCVGGAVIVRRPAAAIAPALAIAAQVPLWVLWGGLIPDPGRAVNEAAAAGVGTRPGLHPESALHQLTIAGFVFWPAIRIRRDRIRATVLYLFVGLALYVAFSPDMAFRFSGPLRAITTLRGGILRPLLPVMALCGWMLAMQIATGIIVGESPPVERSLAVTALFGWGTYLASPIAFDRYSLTFTPFWLLVLAPSLGRRPRIWSFWLVALLAVALASCTVAWGLVKSPSINA